MRKLSVLAAMLLAGCFGNIDKAEISYLDLGLTSVAWRPRDLTVNDIAVSAPEWLTATAIEYRLLYADAQRRRTYAAHRWTAPPPDLIEQVLNRQTPGQGGCRLRLELDRLVQLFDTPQRSRMLLDARASLVAPNRDTLLAGQVFSISLPAPTADARGAVAAAAADVEALATGLGAWLEQLSRDRPAIAERCKAG